jgi:multimeric flavodoxin WrbA
VDSHPIETGPHKQPLQPSIRVLGIAGSPRRRGNTEALLDRFLDGAQGAGAQVEKLVAARLKIAGCCACERCFETGECAIHDDFQGVADKLLAADVIALAAPLYFWNLPAQVKTVIDRSESQWGRKYVLDASLPPTPAGHHRRRGVFISTAGRPHADFAGTKKTVEEFFYVWEAAPWGELLLADVDAKGAIQDHPQRLHEAFELGRSAVSEAWSDNDDV